jgi:hypothetical protein
MASDADYAAFLEKANQDTSGGSSAAAVGGGGGGASSGEFASARAVDTDVPDELQGVMGYTYVSETDEPFEPVSLKWAHDELPSEGAQMRKTANPSPLPFFLSLSLSLSLPLSFLFYFLLTSFTPILCLR